MVRYLGLKPPTKRKRKHNAKKKTMRRRKRSYPLSGGGMTYYSSPIPYMRGRGLGGSIVSLFKRIIPFLRRNPKIRAGLSQVGKSVASAGLSAAQSALDKENPQKFKAALRQSVRDEARKLVQSVRQGQGIKGGRPPNQSQSDIFS